MKKALSKINSKSIYIVVVVLLIFIGLNMNVYANGKMMERSASGSDVNFTGVSIEDFSEIIGEITSVSLDASVLDNITGSCSPGAYGYEVLVNGDSICSNPAGQCYQEGIDLSSYLPLTSVMVMAMDKDGSVDDVKVTMLLHISYNASWFKSDNSSGPDWQPVVVTFDDFTNCPPTGTLPTSLELSASIGDDCPTSYAYSIVVDGTTIESQQCDQNGLSLMQYMPVNTVSIISSDEDGLYNVISLFLTLKGTYITPCYVPTAQTANNITPSSAFLNWTDDGNASAYEIEYGPAGFALGSGTKISSFVTKGHALRDLSSKTAYDWYVRKECGIGYWSNYAGPHQFTTTGNCGGFSIRLMDWAEDGWEGGDVSVYINGEVVLQQISLPVGMLSKFYYFQTDEDDIISTIYSAGNDPLENQYFIYDGSFEIIAAQGDGEIPPGNIGNPAIPSGIVACCPSPSDLSVSHITYNSAKLHWSENGSATKWRVEWGPTNFQHGNGKDTIISNDSIILTGLESNKTYDWYVESDCGGNEYFGYNSSTNTFTTKCGNDNFPWIETFEEGIITCWTHIGHEVSLSYSGENHTPNGSYCMRFTSHNMDPNYNMYSFSEPQMIDYSFTELAFWTKDHKFNDGIFEWGIGVTTDPNDYTWSQVDVDTIWTQTTTGALTQYVGQLVYIGFHFYGVTPSVLDYVVLDDISIQEICTEPTAQSVVNITNSSAKLTWQTNGGNSNSIYDIEYGPTPFTPTGNPTQSVGTNSYNISGLASGTEFAWYVRANCGGDNTSAWIGPHTFSTTDIVNTNFPYQETFEGSSLPDHWTKMVHPGNDITISSDENHTPGGSRSVRFSSYDVSSNYNQYLFSMPQVISSSYTNLSFWHKKSDDDPELFEYGIASSTNPDDYTWIEVSLSYTEWQKTIVDLSAYIGQTIYIGFHYYGDYLYYVYLDDVNIEASAPTTHTISLSEGWLGWSSYNIPVEKSSMEEMMAPVLDNMIITQYFNEIYYPFYGINTMGSFSNAHGYVSKMSANADLSNTGTFANPTIELNEGWNIMPVISPCDVDVTLLGDLPELIIACEIAGGGIYYPEYSINTINLMVPGSAYWVKVDANTSFTFPACADAYINSSHNPLRQEIDTPWNKINYTGILHTVVFEENAISQFQAGDVIGAFTQLGLCAGINNIRPGSATGLNVFGHDITTGAIDGFTDGEALIFKVFRPDNATVYELDVTYNPSSPNNDGLFSKNGLSLISSLTMNTSGNTEQSICNLNIYPNPSKGLLHITGNISNQDIELLVFNSYGQVVYQEKPLLSQKLNFSKQPSGAYFFQFITDKAIKIEKVFVE